MLGMLFDVDGVVVVDNGGEDLRERETWVPVGMTVMDPRRRREGSIWDWSR